MVEQLTDRQRSATIEPASVEEAADGATVQSLAAELAELRGQIDAAVAVGVPPKAPAGEGVHRQHFDVLQRSHVSGGGGAPSRHLARKKKPF